MDGAFPQPGGLGYIPLRIEDQAFAVELAALSAVAFNFIDHRGRAADAGIDRHLFFEGFDRAGGGGTGDSYTVAGCWG